MCVREICLRNSWPRPFPSWAPGIKPGMSATTNVWSDDPPNLDISTTPRFGMSVVKWYSAIFGLALEICEISVDLPADGSPIMPMSATRLSSNVKIFSCPFSPCSANFGA